jgi:hypothetical protein
MDQDPIWTQHLQPGERLVWQSAASFRLIRAEASRKRLWAALLGFVSLVLAGAFAYKLYSEVFPAGVGPTLSSGIAAPLYAALALTLAIVAIAQFGRIGRKAAPGRRYAMTSTRLIAINPAGRIIDQVDSLEIAGVVVGGPRNAPDLYVLRTHDDTNVRAFALEKLDQPLEAKALIEQEFLESANEQAD